MKNICASRKLNSHKAASLMRAALYLVLVISGSAAAQTKPTVGQLNAVEAKRENVSQQCQQIMNTVTSARSIDVLLKGLHRIGERNVKACEKTLKSNAKVVAKLKQFEQQAKAKKSTLTKLTPKKSMNTNLPVNRRIDALKREGLSAIASLNSKAGSGTKRIAELRNPPTGRADNFSTVTPSTLAPGVSAVIRANGKNFGLLPGSVTLRTGGETFNLRVTQWLEDSVTVTVPDTVGGVVESNNAVVSVRPTQEPVIHIDSLSFVPKIVEIGYWDAIALFDFNIFNFAGGSGETRFFESEEINEHWTVTRVNFHPRAEENCGFGRPVANTNSRSLESVVTWFYTWFKPSVHCLIEITIVGPQGVETGTSDLRTF